MTDRIERTDEEWREQLSHEQYRVVREGDTEPPFTGVYYDHDDEGLYHCVACGNALFRSDTKFESGSGWPSFWAPASEEAVVESEDTSHGTVRTEIRCARCDAHLGHVFPDGPRPTGTRYCINSLSLDFEDE